MKFIRKIYRMLMRSPYTLPVCGLVAVMSVVYSGYETRELITGMTIGERNILSIDQSMPQDVYISDEWMNQEILDKEDVEYADDSMVTFFSSTEIDLPEASPSDPSEQETEHIETEQVTSPPAQQKPAQTTKPQTSESQTTKPQETKPQTSKPSQTVKPEQSTKPQTQVTGWNVTLSQAKKMVKADSAYDYEDLYWLSRIISAEAKGEGFTGQIGVGTVVLNRVRSSQFPNTVKGVVFDKKYGTQFTPVANGTIYQTPTQSAVIAAKMCLDGYTLSNSVLYFLNPSIATSSWIQNNRKYAFRVGNHEFYY